MQCSARLALCGRCGPVRGSLGPGPVQPEQDLAEAGLKPQTCAAFGGIGRFGFHAQDPCGHQRLWQGWGLGPGAAQLEEALGWGLRPRTCMAGRDVGGVCVQAQDLGGKRGLWGFGSGLGPVQLEDAMVVAGLRPGVSGPGP